MVASTRRPPKQCRNFGTGACATQRAVWIFGLPSPHHATRPLASEEMPPHLVMQAGEKIRYIMFLKRAERPGLERLNANGLACQRSRIMGHHFVIPASCSVTSMRTPPLQRRRPSTPVPARRQSQRTLSEVFFNREGCHIPQTPAETSVLRGENFTALNAPTKALKNARIGRPFRQRRTMG